MITEKELLLIIRKIKVAGEIQERIVFWGRFRDDYQRFFNEAIKGERKATIEEISRWQDKIWEYDRIINELKFIQGVWDYLKMVLSGAEKK